MWENWAFHVTSYCNIMDMLVHVQSIHERFQQKLLSKWDLRKWQKVKHSLRIFMGTFPVNLFTSLCFNLKQLFLMPYTRMCTD